MSNDRLLFQLTFHKHIPYEERLHTALKMLPRGYAKQVFLRVLSGIVPADATVTQMRAQFEKLVVAPLNLNFGASTEDPHGASDPEVSADLVVKDSLEV